ncbi:MAG: hypothetical protein ACM3SW_11320 [Actinomycetota bacterium]
MLSPNTLAYLSTLTYRADAKRLVCILPLGSIYWDDEMPPMWELVRVPEADREEVLRVFALRMKIWDREILSEDDQQFWDSVRSAAPSWAIFQRLELSPGDQRERAEAEQACAKEFEEFLADADEVTVSEGKSGLQSFSATFRLTEDEPTDRKRPSFWSRMYKKLGPRSWSRHK